MQRRDLLKLSPGAVAATVGHAAFAQTDPQSAPASSVPVFNIRTYGVTGDGKTIDSPSINKAISAVSAAGGGTLAFPAGTYMCFTIHLKSNVEIHLSRGCTILAADSPRPGEATGYNGGTYDSAEPNDPWTPYQDYGHNHWHNSLFYAEGEHDFSVTGPGLIFGRGLSHGSGDVRGGYFPYRAEQSGVGNKTFGLKNCHNVTLRDFSVLKGGHFAVLATGVDNLILENLLIDTDRDGFDIDCCRNVRVSGCTVNSPWDDAICPKSSYALGYRRSTDNITISNNYVCGYYELGTVIDGTWKKIADDSHVPRQGRIKCGTESNGGFRNITITGNVIEGCKGIALESADGAFLEDIAITGNTMRDIVDAPLFLCLSARNRNPKDVTRPGTLRRILISNLDCYNANASTASLLVGIGTNLIEDIKLSNVYIGTRGLPNTMLVNWGERSEPMPDWHSIHVPDMDNAYPELLHFGPTPVGGFFIRHLRNLEMSHVEVASSNPDPRPAFWLEDVHRADFFAITASNQQNFSLHHVSDLRIAWSRAANDTSLAAADDRLI